LSSLSQEESRSISENVKWGQRKKFSDGKFSLAYSQFLGYDKGEDGTLVINEEQAKVVRQIYGDFIAGLSTKAIANRLTAAGIKTPGGKDKWYASTVHSILKNEKYSGSALLQKTYTPDFLTKKAVKNVGQVPQFYVEDSHPAIIDPVQFQLVQDIFAEQAEDPRRSGATIFSGKIRCGECGGTYGQKIWHSNDKYRKVVWRCNRKYSEHGKKGKGCTTPHLTEDEIKAAFVKLANRLITDREFYVTELTAIKDRLSDTTELEKEKRMLDEQLRVDAKAVNDLIARNARVAQNQKEYQEKYDALVSRYEETKSKSDSVSERIRQKSMRRRKLERFISAVGELPELITEFDGAQWASLVETMTVYSKERIVFTLTSGMEIEI
ncbi:MAG: recombinase family protein, partial [Chordicoccus sp.]